MALLNTEGMTAQLESFTQLPVVRQLGLMFGLAASVALGVAVVLWSKEPSYGVLFGDLGNQDAPRVMEVLQQKGVQYKLDERTGALLVPSAKVHELRIELAKEGLPRTTGHGLEIIQQKQDYGTTQFMETARYQYALEGELARSVETLASVESARVHLALPKQSVFVRKKELPSASVLVNLYPGRSLEEGQIAAISHMVASSVPNLEPERVTIVDQRGRLLSKPERSSDMGANKEQFEYARQVEQNYVDRIENILMPIAGMEGVRAQVTADMDFTVTEKTEETYNPDAPALRSQQKQDERTTGGGIQGVPGALSNQPPSGGEAPEIAQGAKGQGGNSAVNERSRSTTNYELDRAIAHSKMATGVVKRLSVAVVLDDRTTVNAEGASVREARSEEELARITALVKDAVGFNAARGDSVNVINASFDGLAKFDTLPAPPLWEQPWAMDLAKMVLGTIVVLVLILGVLRPVLRNLAGIKDKEKEEAAEGEEAVAEGMLAGVEGAVAGELAEDQLSLTGQGPEATIKLPGPDSFQENIKLIQKVVREDPKLVAQVVKTWLAEEQ